MSDLKEQLKKDIEQTIKDRKIDLFVAAVKNSQRLGLDRESVSKAISEALKNLTNTDRDWFCSRTMTPEGYKQWREDQNRLYGEHALNMMTQSLIQHGCQLGRDFSIREVNGEREILISPNSKDLVEEILSKCPQIEARIIEDVESPDPVELLENLLGVPFFENLLRIVIDRLPTLTHRAAASYLDHIAQAIALRHPEIDIEDGQPGEVFIWLLHHICLNMGEEYIDKLAEAQTSGDRLEIYCWMGDLVKAAGGEHLLCPEGGLSPGAWLLLDKVAQAPNGRFSDIALMLERELQQPDQG